MLSNCLIFWREVGLEWRQNIELSPSDILPFCVLTSVHSRVLAVTNEWKCETVIVVLCNRLSFSNCAVTHVKT